MSNTIKIVGGLIGLFALVSYSIGQYLAFALLMTVLAPVMYYIGVTERGVKTAYSKTVYALVTITIFSWSWMLVGLYTPYLPKEVSIALLVMWMAAIIIAAILVVKKMYVEKSTESVVPYSKDDVFEVPLIKLAVYFFFVLIVGGMLLSFLTVGVMMALNLGSAFGKNLATIGSAELGIALLLAVMLTYMKSKKGFRAK